MTFYAFREINLHKWKDRIFLTIMYVSLSNFAHATYKLHISSLYIFTSGLLNFGEIWKTLVEYEKTYQIFCFHN